MICYCFRVNYFFSWLLPVFCVALSNVLYMFNVVVDTNVHFGAYEMLLSL